MVGNHLTDEADMAAMVSGVKLAREIAATAPLSGAIGREIYPGPEANDDEAIAADLRKRVELLYHPVGTCRMGGTTPRSSIPSCAFAASTACASSTHRSCRRSPAATRTLRRS